MDASKRKRKAFYRRCANDGKRQKKDKCVLCPGMRGFFATCNRREVECLQELRNILTTVHSELDSACAAEEIDQDDIAKAIQEELRDTCGEKNDQEAPGGSSSGFQKQNKQLFRQARTNTKNCLFIQIPTELIQDVTGFALRVFQHIESTRAAIARYTMRFLPISETCHADLESLRNAAKRLIETHFPQADGETNKATCESAPEARGTTTSETVTANTGEETRGGKQKTFCCVFESRNNDSMFRQEAVIEVANVVRSMRSDLTVDYKQPDVVILIEVICNVVCLGVAPRYAQLRKYNLIEYGRTITASQSERKQQSESPLANAADQQQPPPEATQANNLSALPLASAADSTADLSTATNVT